MCAAWCVSRVWWHWSRWVVKTVCQSWASWYSRSKVFLRVACLRCLGVMQVLSAAALNTRDPNTIIFTLNTLSKLVRASISTVQQFVCAFQQIATAFLARSARFLLLGRHCCRTIRLSCPWSMASRIVRVRLYLACILCLQGCVMRSQFIYGCQIQHQGTKWTSATALIFRPPSGIFWTRSGDMAVGQHLQRFVSQWLYIRAFLLDVRWQIKVVIPTYEFLD